MAKRILIVEDDRSVREFVAAALVSSRLGFEIEVAENGARAADLLAQQRFDVVITDLNMPEMDGAELADLIRDRYPEIRVVLMSGTSSDWISKLASRRLDALPLLTKPVSVAELVAVVDDLAR